MRAFCMMCQRYLTNVNTAVKEQVTKTIKTNNIVSRVALIKKICLKAKRCKETKIKGASCREGCTFFCLSANYCSCSLLMSHETVTP